MAARFMSDNLSNVDHSFALCLVQRLRNCVRPIQKKGCDPFKRFLPDVHCAVNAIARFRPVYFASSDFPRLSLSSMAELNVE